MAQDLLTIGDIQASLGIKVTGDFIVNTLGVQPHSTDKRAQFYTEGQYNEIREKLVEHIENADDIVAAEKKPPKAKTTAPAATAPTVDDDEEL